MLNRSLIAGLFFVLCGVSPAFAETGGITKDLSKTSAGIYTLDKSHANIFFKISHLGFSMYHGRFNALDARLNFDPKVPEKSLLEVTVDTTSIDTNNEKLETELKGEKFFNTAKFPTATFKSLHVTRTGDNGTMIGELSMLGVSKPVTLNVTFHGTGIGPFSKKETLGFSATGTINRSQWGLTGLLPMIGDEVLLDIEAEFNYSGTAAPIPAVVTPKVTTTTTTTTTTAPAAAKDDIKKK